MTSLKKINKIAEVIRQLITKRRYNMRISHMNNGLKVATDEQPSHQVALGVYLRAGARHQSQQYQALLTQKLAFKSTRDMTRDSIALAIEEMGGSITSLLGRECLMLQGVTFKQHVARLMELYSQVVKYPLVTDDEFQESVEASQWEAIQQRDRVTEHFLPQLSHQTAFGLNTGLGHALAMDTDASITKQQVLEFYRRQYRPENLVVAAVGISHDDVRALVERYFSDTDWHGSQIDVTPPKTKHKYVGGMMFQQYQPPAHLPPNLQHLTHVQLSFKSPAITDDRDVYAASVLQVLLGGGDSFSAGGPGKGMYSRFYQNILNRHHWAESIVATNQCYSDSGLFTIHATAPHQAIPSMMNVVAMELRAVMDKPLEEASVQRAKNQLMSMLFMNMESRLVLVEDVGRQVLIKQHHTSPKQLAERIRAVTKQDVKRVLSAMTNPQRRPTFVLLGNKAAYNEQDFRNYQKKYDIGAPL